MGQSPGPPLHDVLPAEHLRQAPFGLGHSTGDASPVLRCRSRTPGAPRKSMEICAASGSWLGTPEQCRRGACRTRRQPHPPR